MKYIIEEIHPKVLLLSFDNSYDLAMHFCRVQEFYENSIWKNKFFTMLDFVEWYSLEKGNGAFTYPNDWSGFNVPSKVFRNLYAKEKIPDPNKYDKVMIEILNKIDNSGYKGKQFYLIGSLSEDKEAIKHEFAHALWSTNIKYKKEMKKLISELTEPQHNALKNWLKEKTYCDEVIDDEIQAYLSTGMAEEMVDALRKKRIFYRTMTKPFKKLFKEYYNNG